MSKDETKEGLSVPPDLKQQLKRSLNKRPGWFTSPDAKLSDEIVKVRQARFKSSLMPSPLYTKNFIIMGAPGAGKGTLAEALKRELGILSISTGESLRAQQTMATSLGKKIKETLLSGRLVSDEIVNELVRQAILTTIQTGSGFLLDGYPRNAAQLNYLDTKAGDLIDAVIYLKITAEQAHERMLNRRHCSECNRSYNYNFNIPFNTRLCPACNGKLVKRDDDNSETIKRRIELFEQQTSPLLDLYRKQSKLLTFDATKHPDDIAAEIRELFYKDWQGKDRQSLHFWDSKTQERFLLSLLRLSGSKIDHCLTRSECRSEFKRLKQLYPWPLIDDKDSAGEALAPLDRQTELPTETGNKNLLSYGPPPPNNSGEEVVVELKNKQESFPLEEELRKIHQSMLDKLVRSKEAKINQSVIVEETEQADEIFDILASLDDGDGGDAKKRGLTDKPLSKRRSGYAKWLKDYLLNKRKDWGLEEQEGEDIQPPLPGLGREESRSEDEPLGEIDVDKGDDRDDGGDRT